MRYHLLGAVLGFLVGCGAELSGVPAVEAAEAPSLTNAQRLLPVDPRISVGHLENGFTYYLLPEAKAQRTNFFLAVKAGSLQEAEDQRGLAHLVEHMAFNGTTRFPKQAIVKLFEQAGNQLGPDLNAQTEYTRTVYRLSLPSARLDLAARALDVMQDWASAVSFEPQELEQERRVVLAEAAGLNGPVHRFSDNLRSTLLSRTPYQERDPIGVASVIQSAPRQRLVDFYQDYYRPDRMALFVLGAFDREAAKKAIEKRFGSLPNPQAKAGVALPASGATEWSEPAISVQPGVQAAIFQDKELPGSVLSLLFKRAERGLRTREDVRLRVTDRLVQTLLQQRLAAFSRRSAGVVGGVSVELDRGLPGVVVFGCHVQVKQNLIAQTTDEALLEFERLRRFGVNADELARAKTELGNRLRAEREGEMAGNGAIPGYVLDHFFSDHAMVHPQLRGSIEIEELAKSAIPDVNDYLKEWLNKTEHWIVLNAPPQQQMTGSNALLAAYNRAQAGELQPDQVGATEESTGLMALVPKAGTIVGEQQIKELDVTVWQLSNGARVVVKPTSFEPAQILEQSISFGGSARLPKQQVQRVNWVHELVPMSGIGAHTPEALQRLLVGKQVNVFPWIAEQDEGVRGATVPRDLETMLQLMHEYVTAPRRDETAFLRYRESARELLHNAERDPQLALRFAIQRELWGDDPRRVPMSQTALERMDLDAALAFYKDRFADVSDFTFVFVGNVDANKLRPLAERYLASLPGAGRKEKPVELGLHPRPGARKLRMKAGKADRATSVVFYHGETQWSEAAHTDLDSLVRYINLRLREVLREELGAVYLPEVNYEFHRVPTSGYTLSIVLNTRAGELEKAVKATQRVLAEIKTTQASSEAIAQLSKQRTEELNRDYKKNEFWLEPLVEKYKMGEDPRNILILHDLTRRVTSENIQRAAVKFLRDDHSLDARLVPE